MTQMRELVKASSGFYSLHRETYSVTCARPPCGVPGRTRFYSLHRETYSVTPHHPGDLPHEPFLFAASRDVQRDLARP